MEPGARAQGTQLPVCSWVTEAEQAEEKKVNGPLNDQRSRVKCEIL